jgi:HEPN domain-containing protein
MSPEEDARDVARRWLDKATGDLAAARHCLLDDTIPPWIAGFHLQQAAEKAMKGLLVLGGQEPPAVHDLARLHRLLVDSGIEHPLDAAHLKALLPFAVEERYPLLTPEPADSEEVRVLVDPVGGLLDVLEQYIAYRG